MTLIKVSKETLTKARDARRGIGTGITQEIPHAEVLTLLQHFVGSENG